MSSPSPSRQPQTITIIKTVFEGLVLLIRAIKCKFSCSTCNSDCQQPNTPVEEEEKPLDKDIFKHFTML